LKLADVVAQGEINVDVVTVLNICIGKWNTHGKVCTLIPELHHDGHSPQLTPDEQKAFYEKGLRPAIARLTDLTASKWPVTYEDEMFHVRGWNGQLSFCSRVVGEWLISNLGDAIRDSLAENGCSWGTGLVFFHQVKGVKHPSGHTLNAA
jgi:hypothetical protein